jgi:hypothetical protein
MWLSIEKRFGWLKSAQLENKMTKIGNLIPHRIEYLLKHGQEGDITEVDSNRRPPTNIF